MTQSTTGQMAGIAADTGRRQVLQLSTLALLVAHAKVFAFSLSDITDAQAGSSIKTLLEKSAAKLGITSRRMLSGAGHDAMIMADITNIGLVFVPSRGGRSHCPEEWTDYDLLQNGIETVCETVQRLACEG